MSSSATLAGSLCSPPMPSPSLPSTSAGAATGTAAGAPPATAASAAASATSNAVPRTRQLVLGVCAMDKKTRSKPMTQILDRLRAYGEFQVRRQSTSGDDHAAHRNVFSLDIACLVCPVVLILLLPLRALAILQIIIFGDALILDEAIGVDQWPICHCLISFTSKGFPLQRVIDYVRLRKPFTVNDLPSQSVLQNRYDIYRILEKNGIPTPRHLYMDREKGKEDGTGTCARMTETQLSACGI
jgi:inositol hexakisphosphate/diphosphoinositol-pentakisphosphate kinase